MTHTPSAIHDINISTPASQFGNPASHFGKQVRKERAAKGWTIRDLSRVSELDPGHLSRIERGRTAPTEYSAAKLDKTFPHRKGWFSEYQRDSQAWTPPGYRHWTEYENVATRLHVWSPGILDGLLQTEDYARAQLETVPGVSDQALTARLNTRLERQRRVLRSDNPPAVWFLVDELSLYCCAGSAEIMAAQLDHVLTVAQLPDVTVQIVPAKVNPAKASELIVADNAAYAEHVAAAYVFTEPETITSLARVITTIQAESYRQSESIQIIERIRDIWANGESPLTAPRREGLASK